MNINCRIHSYSFTTMCLRARLRRNCDSFCVIFIVIYTGKVYKNFTCIHFILLHHHDHQITIVLAVIMNSPTTEKKSEDKQAAAHSSR